MAASDVPSSKHSGEEIEAIVCDRVPEVSYVPDRVARWHDACVDEVLEPDVDLLGVGINLLEVGTAVEIKGCQIEYANSRSGRFYIRKRQHERLVEESGAYLFAVYGLRGTDHRVAAMAIATATTVDGLISDGWTTREERSGEEGYRQLAWSRVIPTEVVR